MELTFWENLQGGWTKISRAPLNYTARPQDKGMRVENFKKSARYGVATISRLLRIKGLFSKRAL